MYAHLQSAAISGCEAGISALGMRMPHTSMQCGRHAYALISHDCCWHVSHPQAAELLTSSSCDWTRLSQACCVLLFVFALGMLRP